MDRDRSRPNVVTELRQERLRDANCELWASAESGGLFGHRRLRHFVHFPPISRIVHGEYKVVLDIYYAKLTFDKTCMLTSSRSGLVRANLCVCLVRTKTSQTVHYLTL